MCPVTAPVYMESHRIRALENGRSEEVIRMNNLFPRYLREIAMQEHVQKVIEAMQEEYERELDDPEFEKEGDLE